MQYRRHNLSLFIQYTKYTLGGGEKQEGETSNKHEGEKKD